MNQAVGTSILLQF